MKSLSSLLTKKIPERAIASINISTPSIYNAYTSYKKDSLLSLNTLYSMITYGTNFEKFPFIVKPNREMYERMQSHSLLETLIISGEIYTQ